MTEENETEANSTKRLGVVIPQETYKKFIDKLYWERDGSVTDFLRNVIEKYVSTPSKQKPQTGDKQCP